MPMFENFRKDPRYAEQLRRIGHQDAEWAVSWLAMKLAEQIGVGSPPGGRRFD